jgi:Mn2+/Fe2+ NRAMP family transporter
MASSFRQFASTPWGREFTVAAAGLLIGATLMPVLIFYAGAATLGRFDGASLGGQFASLFAGLKEPSIASWTVLLGPYGLYLLFKALRAWWRASAKLG